MNAKQQYQAAYRMIRSQWNWNLKDGHKSYNAYQLASKVYGSEAAVCAYNTLCTRPLNLNK